MKLADKSKTIRIIDSIMGSGKTTYIIKEMNTNKAKRYIYAEIIHFLVGPRLFFNWIDQLKPVKKSL